MWYLMLYADFLWLQGWSILQIGGFLENNRTILIIVTSETFIAKEDYSVLFVR